METGVPDNLLWVVGVIVMLVQGLKQVPQLARFKAFLPLLCVAMGMVGAGLMGLPRTECFQMGFVIGLMASGGYEMFRGLQGGQRTDDRRPLTAKDLAALKVQPIPPGLMLLLVCLLPLCLLAGCVNIKTDPETGQLEISTFLKDIEADRVSYSSMDGQGNGKTFDMQQYQSRVPEMIVQAYNMGVQVGAGKNGE